MVAGVALILLIAVLGPTAFLARSVQILVSPQRRRMKKTKEEENGAAQIVIANWKEVRRRTSSRIVETNGIVKSGTFNSFN